MAAEDYGRAEVEFEKALSFQPDMSVAKDNLWLARERQRRAEANARPPDDALREEGNAGQGHKKRYDNAREQAGMIRDDEIRRRTLALIGHVESQPPSRSNSATRLERAVVP